MTAFATAFRPPDDTRSAVIGHTRLPATSAAALVLRDQLVVMDVEVRDVVDWPERAASWSRQATRFAAAAPDVWIVLVADGDRGWPRMRERLRGTGWDADRTVVITVDRSGG